MGRIVVRGTRDNPKVYADYYDVDGTRRTRLLKGTRNKSDGRKLLAQIEARIAEGKPGMAVDEAPAPEPTTCGALMEQWLASLQNRNAQDDTTRAKRHLLPHWRGVQMEYGQQLPAVMRWVDEMRAAGGLSGQSLRHNLNLLSRFWSWAIERGHATINPVRMIPQGKRPRGAAKADGPWIKDERVVRWLVDALPEPVSLIFWLGNRSGLRPGEAAGLLLGDLAWLHEGIIRVAHSYGGALKEAKAGESKTKWVPAAVDAEQVLGPWLDRRRAGGAGPDDLLFPFVAKKTQNRRRKLGWVGYRKEYLEDCWRRAVTKVNADQVRLGNAAPLPEAITLYESTRHSFVSRNLEAGVPLDEVSAAVGHSSPVVTKRFYDRFVRRAYSSAIRGRQLGPSEPQTSTKSDDG